MKRTLKCAFLCFLLLSACSPQLPKPDGSKIYLPATLPKQTTTPSTLPESTKRVAAEQLVSVFYATDRHITGDPRGHLYYGEEQGTLQFGTCEVSIPPDHRIGNLESPYFVLRLVGAEKAFESPSSHIMLMSVQPRSQNRFLADLKAQVQQSQGHDAFIFIHGYNVTFENACRRTGQLAYDLEFKGAPILYSWPSSGAVTRYLQDENNLERSRANFEKFLRLVTEQSGARTLHIIAHSMGSRALTAAVSSIMAQRKNLGDPAFNQIVMMAADLDIQEFKKLARSFREVAERTTLYVSSNDYALKVARTFYPTSPRLGEAGPNLPVVSIDRIDTIDVSQVDTSLIGHFYYGEKRSVITDLWQLIKYQRPPDERVHMKQKGEPGSRYWEFRP